MDQLRQPTDTRLLPNNSVRHVGRPRWVASYDGSPHGGLKEGRRRVGLLVPRPTPQAPYGRSWITHNYLGEVQEFPIGYLPGGSHGAWWTAHATELPRDQWQAIRAFWTQL
jgi:hypothetical protein